MGIQGLLGLLSSIQKYAHLKEFAGQKLGVDAYGWLHRGTFACAVDLAQGKPSRAYVDFALSRVRMLQFFGITPYLVFDGGRLPSKAHTERERSERRKEGRRLGLEHLKNGKTTLAYQELQKSVDVTPQMARNLIEELKAAGIDYVVAPYEADSQLVYLERKGVINAILSEDSDLLVFGANVLITKLDQHGGCVVYRRSDLTKCREISLVNWSDSDFRAMAILSGCDYLTGIPGIGLKSAYRLVRQHKTIERIVRTLLFDGKKKLPADYLQAFHNADRTFLYQWVYCPELRQLVNLTSLPTGLTTEDMPYIGKTMSDSQAISVAVGDLDPSTKVPLRSTLPSKTGRGSRSLQQTPDMKIGKPISEFFKAVRTPLAELDPNAFTPSPSQQRLLESQRDRSWSARSTPGSVIEGSSVRAALQRSTPAQARNTSLSSAMRAFSQPVKGQRFCTSTVTAGHDGAGASQAIASPYFSRKVRAKPKNEKAGEAFELFSDDPICEALASTAQAAEEEYVSSQKPQLDRSPKKRKRFEVLNDDSDKKRSTDASNRAESSCSTQTNSLPSTLWSQGSRLAAASLTTASSFTSVEAENDHTRARLSASSQQPSAQWLADLKVPVKQATVRKPHVSTSSIESHRDANTGQQRLQHSRDEDDHFDRASSDKQDPDEVPCSSPCQPCGSASPAVPDTDDDEAGDMGTSLCALTGTDRLLGSEDFLVPQSPGGDRHMRSKLNLDHFVFAQ